MSLEYLMGLGGDQDGLKDGVSEERILACLPAIKQQIAFYRAYPDIFIDDISGYSKWNRLSDDEKLKNPWKGFKFFYFQRINKCSPYI